MVAIETYYAAVIVSIGIGALIGMYVGFWIGKR